MYKKHIRLGKFPQDELDHIIRESYHIGIAGKRIALLSGQFLDIDYAGSTLTGSEDTPEVFIINLEGVDCFTFIEYVEAMRLSQSYSEFELKLKMVRYRSGIISFRNRNHFFTDWREFNPDFVDDVTERIGARRTMTVRKMLNEKEDGAYFVPGIQPVEREISYIPSDAIDEPVFKKLRTGDYAGIYSPLRGLDVSHVGIIIKDKGEIYLRHASSQKKYRKVIDQDFKDYIAKKPGLLVLRPKV